MHRVIMHAFLMICEHLDVARPESLYPLLMVTTLVLLGGACMVRQRNAAVDGFFKKAYL